MYLVKKWIAFMLLSTMPLMVFILCLIGPFDLLWSLSITGMVIIVLCFVARRLLRHAFTAFLDGSGIVTFDISSTGVISALLALMPEPPKINTRLGAKNVSDMYERDLVHTFIVPKKATLCSGLVVNDEMFNMLKENLGSDAVETDLLKMPKEDHNKLFMFEGKPTFVYNRNLDMFVGKDMLSKLETESTLLHAANHITHLIKNLSEAVDPFARYVVELTAPKKSWLAGKMKWILIALVVIVIIIMVALLLPAMLSGMGGLQNIIPAGSGGSIP